MRDRSQQVLFWLRSLGTPVDQVFNSNVEGISQEVGKINLARPKSGLEERISS